MNLLDALTPRCTSCGAPTSTDPLAVVRGVGLLDDDTAEFDMRALSRRGVAWTGPTWSDGDVAVAMAEQLAAAQQIRVDDAVLIVREDARPDDMLVDAGEVLKAARDQERIAMATVVAAVRHAAIAGVSEYECARRAGIDRMTVRKILGKQ